MVDVTAAIKDIISYQTGVCVDMHSSELLNKLRVAHLWLVELVEECQNEEKVKSVQSLISQLSEILGDTPRT